MSRTDSTALPAARASLTERLQALPPWNWFQPQTLPGRFVRNGWVRQPTRLLVSLLVILALTWAGLQARLWTFRETAPIRYKWDLNNAWNQATKALAAGHFKWEPVKPGTPTAWDGPTYWWNRVMPSLPLNKPVAAGRGNFFDGIVTCYLPDERANSGLDYPPIRMYIKTYWVRFIHEHHPASQATMPQDATTYPMLTVNFVFELLGAIGMYRLCRLYRGRVLSLIAACALWFSPAIIYNTFAWPQWDIWALSPVIWGLWATLRRGHWLANLSLDTLAGMLVGLAAMMKGQSLFVAILFPLLMVAMALTDPAPFGVVIRNFYARLATRIAQVPVRLVPLAIGALAVVYVTVLPFTLRYPTWKLAGVLPIPTKGSSGWIWTDIYTHQVENNQPIARLNSWNFTTILGARYGWSDYQDKFAINLPTWSWTASPLMWLLYLAAAVWLLLLPAFFAIRKDSVPAYRVWITLALGAFAAAYGLACALLYGYWRVPLTKPYTIGFGSWSYTPLAWLAWLAVAAFLLTLAPTIKTARRRNMTLWQVLTVLVLGYGAAFAVACALLHWYKHVPLTTPYTIALGTIKLSLMDWLRRVFLVWSVLIMLLTIRARNHIQVILALAALFAAAYAIVPGMHDRYALWPVAFLAAAFCIGPSSVLLYVGISGIALACMLFVCQVHQIPPGSSNNIMPVFTRFFNQTSLDFGYLWLALAIGLTWALTQLSAPKQPWLPRRAQNRASLATRFQDYLEAHLPQPPADGQVRGLDGRPVRPLAPAGTPVRVVLAPTPAAAAPAPAQPVTV